MSLIKVNNRGQQDTLGRRNLIINGAMQVAQRGSTTINGAESYGQVDRFKGYGISGGQFSLAQSTDAPAGFVRSLIATVTSADSSIASGDYYGISHRIEGHNVARLNYGTSNAQTTTLSFYVKSSLTGTFGGAIRNSAANRSFNFSYTINSANTWERKSYTIIGDQTGTWLQGGGIGLRVTFSLGDGSARLASAGSWNAGNYAGVTGQTNLISTGSATLQLTGLQLEQGTIMTDFEHLPYPQYWLDSIRYYYNSNLGGNGPGVVSYGRDAQYAMIRAVQVTFPVIMRATPTVVIQSGSANSMDRYGRGQETCYPQAEGINDKGFDVIRSRDSGGNNRDWQDNGLYMNRHGYSAEAEL